MVPADSIQVSRDWIYSGTHRRHRLEFRVRDCHPLWSAFPDRSATLLMTPSDVPYNPAGETPAVWAIPISLAATDGIDFSFSSSGYLDVSVHQVVTALPMDSADSSRVPRDHRLFVNSPRIFADFHALLLSTPRHPPCALCNLATEIPNSTTNRPDRRSEPID